MDKNKLIKHNGIELTLEQWLRNEMMICFAGWPKEIKIEAENMPSGCFQCMQADATAKIRS